MAADLKERLKRAIRIIESQRALLGDEATDAAIAALQQKVSPLGATTASPPARAQLPMQRKQVTVLFADVVDFTAISAAMDAEEVNALLNELWQRMDRAILTHGGHIDKHIGDAVMAIWGSQTAREDDAARAILAALAMQSEIGNWRGKLPGGLLTSRLQIRIGIHTGPAFLGEVGTTGEYTAIGDTVNTADRLQQAAPVGGILISQDTHLVTRGLFDVQPMEPVMVKGKQDPLPSYLVLQAQPRDFRPATRGVEGIETPMVGREAEMRHLQEALVQTREQGQLRVVTIIGEAGVGKSRLLYEFLHWLDQQPTTKLLLRGRVGQEMQTLPYALIRDMLMRHLHIHDSDPGTTARGKWMRGIGELLGSDPQRNLKARFIGQLVGFDFSDNPDIAQAWGDARQIRDRAQHYMGELLQSAAEKQVVILLLEDLHWSDTSSLDLLGQLFPFLASYPILVVGLARPALFEHWTGWESWGQGTLIHLELSPLSPEESSRLTDELLRQMSPVPEALRTLLVDKAEGNPYYLEELIRMLLEKQVIIKQDDWWIHQLERLETLRIPATLTGILQARLDSLPPQERPVMQRAAVIGRVFWDQAVVYLSAPEGTSPTEPESSLPLGTLRERALIFQRPNSSFADTNEYIFKHALLRDVAYETVLKRDRPHYHARAAQWILDQSGDRASEYAALIAKHLVQAERHEEAIAYLLQAGERAAGQFANQEALHAFSKALELAAEHDLEERYAALRGRERIYELQGEFLTQHQDLAQMEVLADALDDNHRRAETALRQAQAAVTDRAETAVAQIQAAIALAQKCGNVEQEAANLLAWGRAIWPTGQYDEARTHLKQAIRLARRTGSLQIEADCLRTLGVIAYYQQGKEQAREYFEATLTVYHQAGDRRGEAYALNNLGVLASERRDYTAAEEHYDHALRIAQEIGDHMGKGTALSSKVTSAIAHGDHAKAYAYVQEALAVSRAVGDPISRQRFLGIVGDLYEQIGHYTEALACYKQVLTFTRRRGTRIHEAVANSGLGTISMAQGNLEASHSFFERALEINRQIDNRHGEAWETVHLSLLAHYRGDNETAQRLAQHALELGQEIDDRHIIATAWNRLGHALLGLDRPAEAIAAYQRAYNNWEKAGDRRMICEPLAGLARVALAQGEMDQAANLLERILASLEDTMLDRVAEPLRVHLTCIQVMEAAQDPRRPAMVERAYRVLQERAGRIRDPAMRRQFLENVPAHREIAQRKNAAD